ncbi:Uncharacterized protein Zm00014a_009518 [Zea mays]|uniref:Hydroxyproline-rich glycoprotein family protein n=2 Tax=Zea mays TaxID=4577 RepID=B6SWB0_MAIZE|nr:uncharacterized protein LOC100275596 [Zea mays]ACG29143.1 hypothetical protein [Zea mays]ONM53687.1 hydroxyproline-rich glycoprotein family protein [Zea mays]PWZ12920.1 Uncharacterized protein Zm00014a_009518 [Zea mays]|eukprot:NP_001143118.1 uncharacterized protein LOC100275596 [Zea mays]
MQQQNDDTVHAAAIVLAAAARSTSTGLQRHLQQLDDHDHDHANCVTEKKTRWWSRLKAKLKSFRPHGHPQRIADASRSPEPPGAPCAEQAPGSYNYARHAPQPTLAFVAPPPSPATSVLTSESPSPVVLLNANASSYSSPTASIFAIGPYAREPQQLVSPPAFSASAGLTEPSTAPLTPPPESSLQLLATTPSSPEVPFAQFLWSSAAADQQAHCSGGGTGTGTGTASDGFLHAYQLQPGSPVLKSPGSTSSSPPPWNMEQQHWVPRHSAGERVTIKDESIDDGAATGGGEFVFGSNADAAAVDRFAGGEVGGGGTLALGDATEQWPFLLPCSYS